jgi:hypothetical protein
LVNRWPESNKRKPKNYAAVFGFCALNVMPSS